MLVNFDHRPEVEGFVCKQSLCILPQAVTYTSIGCFIYHCPRAGLFCVSCRQVTLQWYAQPEWRPNSYKHQPQAEHRLHHYGCWLHLVASICISGIGSAMVHIMVCLAPSHYVNHCWKFVNWTLRNKLPWNASENIVCEMVAIVSRGTLHIWCDDDLSTISLINH